MSQDKLMYLLADLFNTNIYKTGKVFRGFTQREVKLAPHWNLKSDVTICVDENSGSLLTAFARIRKDLWAYVVITEAGRWMLFFDNDRAKIGVGREHEFGSGNGMQTLKKLKSSVTAATSLEKGVWVPADPLKLIEGL